MKKAARRQAWEDGRQHRKELRKQKKQDKRAAQKEETASKIANGEITPAEVAALKAPSRKLTAQQKSVSVPIAFVLDCSFDELMTENEITSLGSQMTRCYADNRQAVKRAKLVVTSWSGRLRERFEGLLKDTHKNWKGVEFSDDGYVESQAQIFEGIEPKNSPTDHQDPDLAFNTAIADHEEPTTSPDPTHPENATLIYLTSDSPHTITTLLPHKAYIIGGLVDRNRHKGICYARAQEAGIATAKLPIGEYMQMASRFVLTTNQVVAILLK